MTAIKNRILAIFLAMIFSALSFAALAQCPTPLSLRRLNNLQYGTLYVGPGGGLAVMTSAGERLLSGELKAGLGSVGAARFQVSGPPNTPFSIKMPLAFPFSDGSWKLQVQDFKSSLEQLSGVLNSAGTCEFTVGGSLDLGRGAKIGSYTAVGLRLLVSTASGQAASANFTVAVSVSSLISLKNEGNMDFGGWLSRGQAGRVRLGSDGICTSLDPLGPLKATGVPKAARFTFGALEGTGYSIALPESITLFGPGDPLTARAFTCSIPLNGVMAFPCASFSVGATLEIPAMPRAGNYSGVYTVTVNHQ